MLRAAAMGDEKDVHLSVCGFKSDLNIDTFEVVEEILFCVCETRVWERACESVEVEGRIHVSHCRQSWSKWKRCRSVQSDRKKRDVLVSYQ